MSAAQAKRNKIILKKCWESSLKMECNKHECTAQCYEDEISGLDSVLNCVFRCALPNHQFTKYLNEIRIRSSERIKKCAKDCQDKKPRGLINRITSEDSFSVQRSKFRNCLYRCMREQCDMLSSLEKAANDVLIFQSEQLTRNRKP